MVLQTHAFQWFVPHDGGGSGGSAKNGKKCSHRHLRLVPLHDSPNCPMFYGNAIAFPWCACGDPGRRCGGSKHCGAGSGLRGRGGLSQWLLGGQRRNNHGVGGHQNLGIIQCEGLTDSGPELVSYRSNFSDGY